MYVYLHITATDQSFALPFNRIKFTQICMCLVEIVRKKYSRIGTWGVTYQRRFQKEVAEIGQCVGEKNEMEKKNRMKWSSFSY